MSNNEAIHKAVAGKSTSTYIRGRNMRIMGRNIRVFDEICVICKQALKDTRHFARCQGLAQYQELVTRMYGRRTQELDFMQPEGRDKLMILKRNEVRGWKRRQFNRIMYIVYTWLEFRQSQ